MDRIYSEINTEDDHTVKRRISSILKVPRSPLRDLGSGNELNQGCDVEKRQRNSRRVSFAETIKVFPTDLQSNAESDHLEGAAEARHQEPLNQIDEPEIVQCEITGMSTLLHAPIQTPLQETECHDVNSGQKWNKMNRTLLFSEENEMDMTAGHTVMITHGIGFCEETNKSRKIDFKSFSAELKLNEKKEVNENCFLSGPIQWNKSSLPQQKTDVGCTQKIKFDDFLKSLKSVKPFPVSATDVSLPSEVPETKVCSSEVNASFHLQRKSSITNVFGGLDNKTTLTQYCLSNETIMLPTCHASEQTGCRAVTQHCGDESMDMTIASTERVLPAGPGSLTVAKQHQNFESDYSISHDSYRSKPSRNSSCIPQHSAMCINKTTVYNGEIGVSEKHSVKLIREGSLPSNQRKSVSQGFFGSTLVLDGKNTIPPSICSDMEITSNCTGFISNANSKEVNEQVHRTCEKPSKERTVLRDSNMDIIKNQASTKANMNGIPHSNPYNEMAASKQEAFYGNEEQQNLNVKPVSRASSHLENKEDILLVSLPSDKSAVFSAKGIDLSRNYAAKSKAEQGEYQFLLSNDKASFAELNGTNRKNDCSINKVAPFPADKTVMFTVNEDMELTKPTAYLIDKSLKTVGFYKKPQEETRPGTHNIIKPATDKTVVFAFEDNEMEITKSCTVAVNHNFMQHCERDPQVLPLQPVDKTVVYASHNDMDISKPDTCIIDQSLENDGRSHTGSTRDKTVVFCHGDENEMEVTRSHTVVLNYGDAPQSANIPIAMPVPPDKTVMFPFSEDMEITRPVAGAMDKSLKSLTGPLAVLQQGTGTEKKITEITSEKTIVFSLAEDNEMEFTKSCTVAVNHDLMQPYETVPQVLPLEPVDKTVYRSHNNMDRNKSISCLIDQSLENPGAQTVHKLDNEANGRTPIGSTRDKTVDFSVIEDNEMEVTKSCIVAVSHDTIQQIGGAPQAPSPFPAEGSSILVHNNNMAENKSISFIPAEKILMLSRNNDIEITKPIEHVTDSSQKNNKETDKLPGFVEEEAVKLFPQEDNEMEITKSLTVALNHDIQRMEGASQELSLIPAEKTKVTGQEKTKVTGHHNNMVPGVPASKALMCMHSNNTELTEPLTDTSLENTNSNVLAQKEKEMNKAMLSGPINTVKPHDNEMEITKSLTIEVNHDILPHCERIHPVQFYQDSVGITRSHNETKNMQANIMKLGEASKWKVSSNQTLTSANDENMGSAKLHTMLMNNETAQHNRPVSKTGLLIPLNKNSGFMCYQDGKEINKLLPNVTADQSLEEKQALNKNTNQELGTSHGITQDRDITRNHTVNIYGPNTYVSDPEKQILHLVAKSREKTVAFSDGETMSITRNHTIGTEFMNTNNCNSELSSCSQTESGSKFPSLVAPNEKESDINETDRRMPEKSISSSNMELCVSVNKVNTQNLLRIQDNQLESHTSKIKNFATVSADHVHCHEENECMTPTEMVVQNAELCGETTLNLNMEKKCTLLTESETSKDYPGKLFLSRHEGKHIRVTGDLPVAATTTNTDSGHVTKDWQTNVDLPINNLCSKEDLLSKQPRIINDCSKLMNPGENPRFGLMSQNGIPNLEEELVKPKDPLELAKGTGIEFSNVSNELKNKSFTESDPFCVPFNTMQKDNFQIKKLPLGIFPPKLPNKRKSTISNVADIGERTKPQDSEKSLPIKKSSEKITQHLSPSHYISEELIPPCVEDMDSSELQNSEQQEKFCDVRDKKEIGDHERQLQERNRQKRVWNQEGEELQKEKKLKVDEGWSDTTELKQTFSSIIVPNEEILDGRNTQDTMASNMERTHSSNGSSLDSMKVDSDLSIQRNAEIEAELLMDSTCEQNLQEKLREGVITVGEFFTLLQVHILIQKPRQSLLPPKYTVNASPTPEDLILCEYVYLPKYQIYNEDCQALSEIIEEVKLCADNKDKLLVNVHKSLWEVMRTCSDEELKQFGAELNKMKSCFAKKSKVLAHRGKAKLYMKLVQNAQIRKLMSKDDIQGCPYEMSFNFEQSSTSTSSFRRYPCQSVIEQLNLNPVALQRPIWGELQWEKLQSKLNEMDGLFKEMDNCLVALEAEIAKLEESELAVSEFVAEYESKLKQTEQELENYNIQEEALQREQSNLRGQQQQRISEIRHLQEEAKSCQEHMEKYNFSEWVMKEWNDQQAVFTFLCNSVELTVALGCLVDAAHFATKKFYRKIRGVHFESLLDEAKAPASSKLVQRLIFQFITDQCPWQEKYSTVHHLHQLLHEVSLVVSRCQLLGEEIEFLKRWGGKFNLLKTTVNDTKVKLLFSSSLVFAKFEVELSLSAIYPTSPMAFTVQKYTGNLGQEEISEVLSRVPVGANYLKRIVYQIHHSLLQNPSAFYKQQK